MGLVVTKEHRFPVFYNVFECGKGDMKTVSDTLKVLQKEFKVGRTLLVRDREGEDREIKLAKALKELEAYAAKVNAGNYRKVSRVANKVKELSKGVSKYIKPEIIVEKGRVRLGIKELDSKIEEAQWLDGKYLLDNAGLKITPKKALSYLKWQKKVVFTAKEKMVERVSLPELKAKEIMDKQESVNFL